MDEGLKVGQERIIISDPRKCVFSPRDFYCQLSRKNQILCPERVGDKMVFPKECPLNKKSYLIEKEEKNE